MCKIILNYDGEPLIIKKELGAHRSLCPTFSIDERRKKDKRKIKINYFKIIL